MQFVTYTEGEDARNLNAAFIMSFDAVQKRTKKADEENFLFDLVAVVGPRSKKTLASGLEEEAAKWMVKKLVSLLTSSGAYSVSIADLKSEYKQMTSSSPFRRSRNRDPEKNTWSGRVPNKMETKTAKGRR